MGNVSGVAMARGARAFAFDCPHGPADTIEDGRTGVLVPPLDGDALAAALDRVLGDGEFAQRLRAAGRPAAMRFSAPAIARAYAGLFDDLCAAARH
ncbi:MAG: glycosyltransferase family 4 protein [Chloroflexi bacterium]|nr:glycosyltransferase family 4 protein [Chloroflexota bacterium]